jgi:hypothetical protein
MKRIERPVGFLNQLCLTMGEKISLDAAIINQQSEQSYLLRKFLPPCAQANCALQADTVCFNCRCAFCDFHLEVALCPTIALPLGWTLCQACRPKLEHFERDLEVEVCEHLWNPTALLGGLQ